MIPAIGVYWGFKHLIPVIGYANQLDWHTYWHAIGCFIESYKSNLTILGIGFLPLIVGVCFHGYLKFKYGPSLPQIKNAYQLWVFPLLLVLSMCLQLEAYRICSFGMIVYVCYLMNLVRIIASLNKKIDQNI